MAPAAKTKTDEALAERAKKGEDRQLLVDVILPVLADPSIPDEQVGGLLRGKIGMSKLREVMDCRSMGESFQLRIGSSSRDRNRRCCSSSLTENQCVAWFPRKRSGATCPFPHRFPSGKFFPFGQRR